MAKETLAKKVSSLEVGEIIEVENSYMSCMVTISRLKKEFTHSGKKFQVSEDSTKTKIKRVK